MMKWCWGRFLSLLLSSGWLNFNASSLLFQDASGNPGNYEVAGRAASNTILASTSSMIAFFFLQKLRLSVLTRSQEWPWSLFWQWGVPKWFVEFFSNSLHQGPHLCLDDLNNALLTGAVAITAGCAYVDSIGALWIGAVAMGLGVMTSKVMIMLGVDDPLNVAGVHGIAGFWGVFATGLFATPDLAPGAHHGLLYGGGWTLLSVQIQGALTLLYWSLGMSLFIMCPMLCSLHNDARGRLTLRLEKDEEVAGMDFIWHDIPQGKELGRDLVRYYHEVQAAERRIQARQQRWKDNWENNKSKHTAETTTPNDTTAPSSMVRQIIVAASKKKNTSQCEDKSSSNATPVPFFGAHDDPIFSDNNKEEQKHFAIMLDEEKHHRKK
jgi:hypothetical protein